MYSFEFELLELVHVDLFGGIKPVCHDRPKTVPEFIVILCDQMWMTMT